MRQLATHDCLLDFHTHVFPKKMAAAAVVSIGQFYDLPMAGDGTFHQLLDWHRSAGITHRVIFSTATRSEQAKSIHHFMRECLEQDDTTYAFGTVHPSMDDQTLTSALQEIVESGFHGIKLHPDFQKFYADDPFAIKVARLAAGRLPILLHAGDRKLDFSSPRRLRQLAQASPDTVLIAAHFGGWSDWPEAIRYLSDLPSVHVDTSSSLPFLTQEQVMDLVTAFGTDRIIFGSDYPMWRPDQELRLLRGLPLTDQQIRQMTWDNGMRLLASRTMSTER